MSFGDLATPSGLPPQAATHTSELHRLLKPLGLNNSALRQATQRLLAGTGQPPSPALLKRLRALRDQNRNIAAAAAMLTAHPHFAADHREAYAALKPLLDDFSTLYSHSLAAERAALRRLPPADVPPPSAARADAAAAAAGDAARVAGAAPSVVARLQADRPELQAALEQEREDGARRHAEAVGEDDALLAARSTVSNPQPVYRAIDMRDPFLAERRNALSSIQSSVDDVNSIFKDLAVMVDDQRAQVDYVDLSVSDSSGHVDAARLQLQKNQSRRNRSKSLFFCTLLSIAFIIAIFLIIMLS